MLQKCAPAAGDSGSNKDDEAEVGKQSCRIAITNATQVADIRPSGIYSYFDWLTVWSKSPLPKAQLDALKQHCTGRVDVLNAPARWDPSYRQRLQLFQPQPPALELLASTSGLRQTYLEPALDWTFDDGYALDAAAAIVQRCSVQPYFRGKEHVEIHSHYFGQRWQQANVLHHYDSKPSRITGEVFCEHIEWFLCGRRALRQAGINSLADLLTFDHRKFWQRHLTLCEVDPLHLARLYHNYVTGSARRTPLHRDACDGQVLWFVGRQSAQGVIHHFRRLLPVQRCLRKQPIVHLLPTPAGAAT